MTRVLLTHADEPLGRRTAKALYHDPEVEKLLLAGSGPAPRAFDRFLADAPERVQYARADLARHRSVADLFHSVAFREAAVDTVVHLPAHTPGRAELRVVGGVLARTAEARLVLQHALQTRSVTSLVAVGSATVYRLTPGNANRLRETSEIDLDPKLPPELRSWIDCDMLFHGEVGADRLRVCLLRVPTVVASGGYVYLNPWLAGRAGPRVRAAGFDPLCALLADKDLASAVRAAVHSERAGLYNVAGLETLPLSTLGRWTGRPGLPVPGPLVGAAGRLLASLGAGPRLAGDGARLRYGGTLDTARAERELGFRPRHRIGLERAGDGELRLETSPA